VQEPQLGREKRKHFLHENLLSYAVGGIRESSKTHVWRNDNNQADLTSRKVCNPQVEITLKVDLGEKDMRGSAFTERKEAEFLFLTGGELIFLEGDVGPDGFGKKVLRNFTLGKKKRR